MSESQDPIFFVDRALGKRHVPDALRAFGCQVEIHDDHFETILVSGSLPGPKMAIAFQNALGSMKRFVHHHPAPFMAKVYKGGEVKTWKSHKDLTEAKLLKFLSYQEFFYNRLNILPLAIHPIIESLHFRFRNLPCQFINNCT